MKNFETINKNTMKNKYFNIEKTEIDGDVYYKATSKTVKSELPVLVPKHKKPQLKLALEEFEKHMGRVPLINLYLNQK